MTSRALARQFPVVRVPEPSRGLVRVGDERTPREIEEAPTEPERSPDEFARFVDRDAVASVLTKTVRSPATIDFGERAPTAERSDVFAPLAAGGRALHMEGDAARDRRARLKDRDADTLVDLSAPTLTLRQPTEVRHVEDVDRSRPATDRIASRDRALLQSVKDTEARFATVQERDPLRAMHIEAVRDMLKASGVFAERDVALAFHASEKADLVAQRPAQRQEREDRVFALGLLARDVENAHRARTEALKAHLLDGLRDLPQARRDQVHAEFEVFKKTAPAADRDVCTQQLNRALKEEVVLEKAYVYALALDRHDVERSVEANAATLLSELSGPGDER